MSSFISDSDSDSYGYDLTLSDEEHLIALIDSISPPTLAAPPASAPVPTTKQSRKGSVAPSTAPSDSSLDSYLRAAIAVNETLEDITEDDLNFDITELDSDTAYSHASGSETGISPARAARERALIPRRRVPSSVASGDGSPDSFVTAAKPRSLPGMHAEPLIQYPDSFRRQAPSNDSRVPSNDSRAPSNDSRAPILRFRTFPKNPLSVSDLTAGSWCELQHFYTLTRLPGGRKTRTAAMKAGTVIHERLERQIHTTIEVEIAKREDRFGLKIWNIIQGLRTLRDTGLTREMEVWGFVDGNVVNGVVDGLSYNNPDPELEEDVISQRSSQNSQSSQHQLSLGNKVIFITDVKTRGSKKPPSPVQNRGAIIQLFLYHRFLSDMASDRLDYLRIFERYGMNPDETFSDTFLAQMGALHEELFWDAASEVTETTESASTATADYVSAVSTPSQIAFRLDDAAEVKYRTLRSLIPLLKFEMQLTFPRGASTLGQIVAIEYRYRARVKDDPADGSIICTNSFYVEPEALDDYLEKHMKWWRGEREPRGVPLEEAFKCRSCEFVESCEWRINLEQEALRKAKLEGASRDSAGGSHSSRAPSIQW